MILGKENERLEFKKSTGELSDAMKSVCAILNKNGGGELYFGVLNNGEIIGQEISDSTLRDVSRKISESIEPKIYPTVTEEIFEGKHIIHVVFTGNLKPYSYNGRYYIRTADENRLLSQPELINMIKKNHYTDLWENQITKYTINDIDDETLESYFYRAKACGRLKLEYLDKEKLLASLGLLVDGYLNNAGYYLFGKNVNLNLKLAKFATEQKLVLLDLKMKKNNIYNLIDYAVTYISETINWRIEFNKRQRDEIPEIPYKAYREAIINSFAHASYESSPTEHEINIHPNEITIYNPGTFPDELTPMDFVKKNLTSIKRNPLILDVLFRSDDLEKEASGFKRINEMCNLYEVEWDYVKNNYGFYFIFKRNNNVFSYNNFPIKKLFDLSDFEYEIYKLLVFDEKISKEKISKIVGKSERTIQRTIASLTDKGYVLRVGTKSGYWKILKRIN